MASVAYNGPLSSSIRAVEGPNAVIDDWSGGVLDAANDSLVVWGGGHSGYFGNELYGFSLKTQTWAELDQPSSVAGWNQTTAILPDGNPTARHTYDNLVYLPQTHQLFASGSGASLPNGNSSDESWLIDLNAMNPAATGAWQQAALMPILQSPIDFVTAYDPSDGNVYSIDTAMGLTQYAPSTNTWRTIGQATLADYHLTGAIDPATNQLVATGNGFFNVVDLATGAVSSPTVSGDMTAMNGNAPGFVWDPAIGAFVGWSGGAILYTLDPKTWTWTAQPAAAGSATPTASNGNGTFGRFQYDASLNEFVVVNSTNEDVFTFAVPPATSGSSHVRR